MSGQSRSLPGFHIGLLHPRHWLTWFFLCLYYLLCLLPVPVIDSVAGVFARLSYRNNRKRVHIASTNLSLCFPEKSVEEIQQLVRQHFLYQTISVFHYGLIWWASESRIRRLTELQGQDRIEQLRQQGRQVIALTSHSVGLEFSVMALSLSYPCSGPYKSMKNPVINWLVAKGRTRFGVHAYTREDGFRPLIKDTKNDRVMIYLADEDLGAGRSVFAPFFGVAKATVPVLGRLARQCDAAVLPCTSCYDMRRRKYVVTVFPAIDELSADDAERSASQMNQAIEQTVHECVVQYFWTLRLFKTRPDGEVSVYG